MTHQSVATPTQNYLESEDLVLEIGDEDIETKKKRADDDRVGYGVEAEESEDEPADVDEDIDDFEGFEDWDEEEELE